MALEIISRSIHALKKEFSTPDQFRKGEMFESFVRKKIFTKEHFTKIHHSHGYHGNNDDFCETSLLPDFKLRHDVSGKEIFVECKWRKGSLNYKNQLEWCKPQQLKRYKRFNKHDSKVFIVLGIGGKPSAPQRIVIFPIDDCNYTGLYESFLKKYTLQDDMLLTI